MFPMSSPPIILGAGLTGLSAAYHSTGIVYEKQQRPGGHAKSWSKQGFTFDEGIHVLHTSNEYVLSLLKNVGADLAEHSREAWIHSFETLTRYPFQANTYGLPIPIVKDCLLGFIENQFRDVEKVKTYEDWIYYLFGKGIAEHFMIPYSQKFWGVGPTELTTEWVSVRHPRPTLAEVLDGALHEQTKGFGVNAEFRYPKAGGFGSIGESLAKAVEGRVHYGMRATRVDVVRRQIEFNGQETIPYERVMSTIPLPSLLAMIPEAPAEVREAAGKLRANSIVAVNLGVDRPNLTTKHWIYYPERQYCFFRISFPFNKAAGMAPVGASSIAAEISYGNENALPCSRELLVERVHQDLVKAKVLLGSDRLVFADLIDIPNAYVLYDHVRRAAVKCIHDYLKQFEVYPCGRYGDWTYYWSDEAILSGKKTALELAGKRSA